MIPEIDWPSLTQAELDEILTSFNDELKRRHLVATAEETIDGIAKAVLGGEALTPGDPWRQPSTVGYPKDWVVTYQGKQWKSLIANNFYKPGVAGWREQTTDGTPPQWVQPSGVGDGYQIGELVTFNGQVYRSLVNNNLLSPAVPAVGGWELVEE